MEIKLVLVPGLPASLANMPATNGEGFVLHKITEFLGGDYATYNADENDNGGWVEGRFCVNSAGRGVFVDMENDAVSFYSGLPVSPTEAFAQLGEFWLTTEDLYDIVEHEELRLEF